MVLSLGLILLVGLAMGALCSLVKLPRMVGMLMGGILIGPYGLRLLDPGLMAIGPEIKTLALVIILLRVGLGLDVEDLTEIGRPALLLAILPISLEIMAYLLFAPPLLGVSRGEAALLGTVVGAIAPAVVVPWALHLMQEGYGTEKKIPQMILTGASLDNVFALLVFGLLLHRSQGMEMTLGEWAGLPLSIVLGLVLGGLAGYGLAKFFAWAYHHGRRVGSTTKVMMILGSAFVLYGLEGFLEGRVPLSGLLAVISMAAMLRMKSPATIAMRLSDKVNKAWIPAELALFVLVGAEISLSHTFAAGPAALLLIVLGLGFRSLGVWAATTGTSLLWKERAFCVIAYLPKATVQAAIGAVPLAMGLACGQLVLTMAVISIMVTAPLGAIGMDRTYRKLLQKE